MSSSTAPSAATDERDRSHPEWLIYPLTDSMTLIRSALSGSLNVTSPLKLESPPLPPIRNCIDTVFLSCFSGEELNTLITLLEMAVVDITSRSGGSRSRLVGDGNEGYTWLVEDVNIVSALELSEAVMLLAAGRAAPSDIWQPRLEEPSGVSGNAAGDD